MATFMDMLRFGPQNTMQAQEGTPSIYADADVWEAYRQQKTQEDLDILAAMDARDADSARLLKTAENLQRPVTDRQVAPVEQQASGNAGRGDSQKWDPNEILKANASTFAPQPVEKKHARQDAINANTKAYGVQAFTDEKGQLVLTNKAGATDAKGAMQAFTPEDKTLASNPAFYSAPTGAVAPNTPANVNALFKTLQQSKGFDDAAAVYSSLQNALAGSKAEMLSTAMKFAEQKAGIPQLQKSLEQNIYLDSQKRGGVPGIDSPITTQIRKQLDNARERVDTIAKGYLATNVNYAMLTATEKQADLYMSQAKTKGDVEAQLRGRLAIQNEMDNTQRAQQDAELAGTLPDYTKQRMLMLNPSLVVAGPEGAAAFTRTWKLAQKDKNLTAALSAPPEQMPALAYTGNQYALDIVAAQEAQATGRSKQAIMDEFAGLRARFSGQNGQQLMAEEMARMQGVQSKDKKAAIEAARTQLGQEKVAPEKRADYEARQAMLAMNFAKRTATDRFVQDVGNWGIVDPEFELALNKARTVTGGKPTIDTVLAAYNGDKTGKEAVEQHKKFLRLSELAAAKRQSALFGSPDPTALQKYVQESLKEKLNIMGRVSKNVQGVANTQVPISPVMFPILSGIGSIFNATQNQTIE